MIGIFPVYRSYQVVSQLGCLSLKPRINTVASELWPIVSAPPKPAYCGQAPGKPLRKPLPADLPCERVVHDILVAGRQCASGCTMRAIGEKTGEELDNVPAQLTVIQHVRMTNACSACGERIQVATRPSTLLPKSMISGNKAAYGIAAKNVDGQPLHRLPAILGRYGFELSRQMTSVVVLMTAA